MVISAGVAAQHPGAFLRLQASCEDGTFTADQKISLLIYDVRGKISSEIFATQIWQSSEKETHSSEQVALLSPVPTTTFSKRREASRYHAAYCSHRPVPHLTGPCRVRPRFASASNSAYVSVSDCGCDRVYDCDAVGNGCAFVLRCERLALFVVLDTEGNMGPGRFSDGSFAVVPVLSPSEQRLSSLSLSLSLSRSLALVLMTRDIYASVLALHRL